MNFGYVLPPDVFQAAEAVHSQQENTMFRFLTCVVAALALAIPAVADVESWQIDPAHSAAHFSVRHFGISNVRGSFTKMSGTVQYDPNDPAKTRIEAVIDAGSIDTRVEARDKDLRSPNFFDVEKYPTLIFKSKRAEPVGNGKLKLIGDLTIHGVTKEVALDVDGPTQPFQDPRGNLHMGASAGTKINRKDFGVSGSPAIVGDEVSIIIDVEVVKPGAAK
jgi:polyisoprenoid-binding protein YceI